MNMRMNGQTLFLDRRQRLTLIDAVGVAASVTTGSLWITMENDGRDIVLTPGESCTIERNGCTIVYAGEPTVLRLTDTVSAQRNARNRLPNALVPVWNWLTVPLSRPRYIVHFDRDLAF